MMTPFEFGVKRGAAVGITPESVLAAGDKAFMHSSYPGMILANLASGVFTGGIGPAVGGMIGGMGMHKMQRLDAVKNIIGPHPTSAMLFGSVLGQLLARSHLSQTSRGLTPESLDTPEEVTNMKAMPVLKKVPKKVSPESGIEQATEPAV